MGSDRSTHRRILADTRYMPANNANMTKPGLHKNNTAAFRLHNNSRYDMLLSAMNLSRSMLPSMSRKTRPGQLTKSAEARIRCNSRQDMLLQAIGEVSF